MRSRPSASASRRARVPRRRQVRRGPRGYARDDGPTSAQTVRTACRCLADRCRDDAACAAGESACRRDADADGRDRIRRGVRQHPTIQRRVSRGVPAAAVSDSPSKTPARDRLRRRPPVGSSSVSSCDDAVGRCSRPPPHGLLTEEVRTVTTARPGPGGRPAGWQQAHARRYLETGGQDGHIWEGVPTLLLTTTGRRSGQPRTTPLIYGQNGDRYLVVASRGGAPTHPDWYQNL